MKGTDIHYFVDKLVSGPTTIFTTLVDDSADPKFMDPFYLRLFDRVSVQATIKPAYLNYNGCISSTYCYNSGESTTVYFKSH